MSRSKNTRFAHPVSDPRFAQSSRPEAENIGANANAAMRDVAKCELRNPKCEVQSIRHSKFVIRHCPDPHDPTGQSTFALAA